MKWQDIEVKIEARKHIIYSYWRIQRSQGYDAWINYIYLYKILEKDNGMWQINWHFQHNFMWYSGNGFIYILYPAQWTSFTNLVIIWIYYNDRRIASSKSSKNFKTLTKMLKKASSTFFSECTASDHSAISLYLVVASILNPLCQ